MGDYNYGGPGFDWDDLRRRWRRSSDREKILFLLIIGLFLCSCPTFTSVGIISDLSEGFSLSSAVERQTGDVSLMVLFGIAGLLMLSAAIAIWWRKRR